MRRSHLAAFYVADETRMEPEERERREGALSAWAENQPIACSDSPYASTVASSIIASSAAFRSDSIGAG